MSLKPTKKTILPIGNIYPPFPPHLPISPTSSLPLCSFSSPSPTTPHIPLLIQTTSHFLKPSRMSSPSPSLYPPTDSYYPRTPNISKKISIFHSNPTSTASYPSPTTEIFLHLFYVVKPLVQPPPLPPMDEEERYFFR